MREKSVYHASIKELPEDERPQEKMIRFGAKSLSNAELLAISMQQPSFQFIVILPVIPNQVLKINVLLNDSLMPERC